MVFSIVYALKSISRRKQKNLITAIAIALGVALFIGTQAAGTGVVTTVTKINMEDLGTEDITIVDPTSPNGMFTSNVSELIEQSIAEGDFQDFQTVSNRITYRGSVYASANGTFEKNVGIRAIDPNDEGFGEFTDIENTPITLPTILVNNDTIISRTLAEDMEINKEDEIQISVPDGTGNSTTISLTVKSIYDDDKGRGIVGAGPPGSFRISQLYLNLQTVQNLLAPQYEGYVTDIQITVKGVNRDLENFDVQAKTFPGKSKIQTGLDELEKVLNTEYAGLLIYSERISLVDNQYEDISGLTSVMTLFAIMLNGVALLLIINVQSMAVDDRKNQTAVLRALGSNISSIIFVFMIEALVVGILGAIMGLLLGFIISIWILGILSGVFGVAIPSAGLSVGLIITAALSGIILSIITAVAPSISSARKGIANSLRGIDEPKKPKKGFMTLVLGVILLPLGLMNATQVGDLTDDATWANLDNQVTILLGFGLTLAGIGLLLTLVLSRRIALTISGASLFGVGTFFFVWALAQAKEGDGGNLFSFILLFMIIGSTLMVSENYDAILRIIGKMLFFLPGMQAITQVTTRQMIGKKGRGVLVYTILTVILVLTIFIASAAATQRGSVVDLYDHLSDGVDVVVVTDNTFPGTADRIFDLTQNGKNPELGQIQDVFAFRRTHIALYLVSPLDENFDISNDVVGVPVVEMDESTINPSGNWGDDSLKLQFAALSKNVADITGRKISTNTKDSEHAEIRDETFDLFSSGLTREQTVTHNKGTNAEFKVEETQQMVIGGFGLDWLNLDLIRGATVYVQSINGSIIPLFLGATLQFDMTGYEDYPLYGNSLIVPKSLGVHMPYSSVNENVFLVRSTNLYKDTDANEKLGLAIEKDLNNLNDPTSFSSIQTPANLLGASTTVVQDEVSGFFQEQASFWDFLGAFSTLGLVIGGLGMMIIAVRSVSERTREIGMMRSIGFSRKSVVQGVLIEMLVISILSLIMGLLIAIIFSENFANNLFGVKAEYPMGLILSYVFGLLGIAIVSGAVPGYRASKVAPSQALRYTG